MGNAPVKWYVPESITHLYYSPIYATLAPRQQLVYNQLHACYMCELLMFFEEGLPEYYLKATASREFPGDLRAQLRTMTEAESRHAAMFRALAQRLSPKLYLPFKRHFVRISPVVFAMFRAILSKPRLFPMLFWIALIQEERAVFYAEEILRQAGQLDPEVVDAHRRHIADEALHLNVNEALLALYWDRSGVFLRRLNSRLFQFVMDEFLNVPKRGGIRLVNCLVKECSELEPRRAELQQAMLELGNEPTFHESLYSRRIVPKTFALFDRYREFRQLGKSLWGYAPQVSS